MCDRGNQMNQGEQMNYFQQIIFNSRKNIKLLLKGSLCESLTAVERKILFKRHVEIINLELSYQCNRKCDYCPVEFSNRRSSQRYMDKELLLKICGELAEIRYENRISLNLYNEPLMDEYLEEKIRLIRDMLPHCHLAFNSNGDYLDAKRLHALADSGLNFICVTLHAPPNKVQREKTIVKRIRKLFERLEHLDNSDRVLMEMAAGKTLTHINVRGVRVQVQWPDWRVVGSNRAGVLSDHESMSVIRMQPCSKPFREFTIFYDGNVQPCCEAFYDDTTDLASIGNAGTEPIFYLYTSKRLSGFRRGLFDFGQKTGICASCTVQDYSSEDENEERKFLLQEP